MKIANYAAKISFGLLGILSALGLLALVFPLPLPKSTECTYSEASAFGYLVWAVFAADFVFRWQQPESRWFARLPSGILILFPAVRILGSRFLPESVFAPMYIAALSVAPFVLITLFLAAGIELVCIVRKKQTSAHFIVAFLFFLAWECQDWTCS